MALFEGQRNGGRVVVLLGGDSVVLPPGAPVVGGREVVVWLLVWSSCGREYRTIRFTSNLSEESLCTSMCLEQ